MHSRNYINDDEIRFILCQHLFSRYPLLSRFVLLLCVEHVFSMKSTLQKSIHNSLYIFEFKYNKHSRAGN